MTEPASKLVQELQPEQPEQPKQPEQQEHPLQLEVHPPTVDDGSLPTTEHAVAAEDTAVAAAAAAIAAGSVKDASGAGAADGNALSAPSTVGGHRSAMPSVNIGTTMPTQQPQHPVDMAVPAFFPSQKFTSIQDLVSAMERHAHERGFRFAKSFTYM
jgi:hypothetical protein